MKKTLSMILAVTMLFCMMSAFGIIAESADTTLNVDVDTGEMTAIPVLYPGSMGITPWGGEEVDKLFDGKYGILSDDGTIGLYGRTDEEKGTKLGGLVTEEFVTVSFSTESASIINYYTFYTGFDTALETDRNPTAWILYGFDGDDWQVIHEIKSDETVSTGMEPLNCAPYTYAVPADARGVYTDYLFEFTVDGEYFQLNEIILYGEVGVEEPSDDPADEPAATTDAATTTTPSTTTDTDTDDTAEDGTTPVVPITIAAVAVIAAAVVIIIVVLKKKKG